MQMRAPLQIQSIIKAMTDVVLPAIDPDNKLAQEQARLVLGSLALIAKQLPLQYRYDCDELARLEAFCQSLQSLAQGGTETTGALAALALELREAGVQSASPEEIEQRVRNLRQLSGAVITAVYVDGSSAARKDVRAAVLAMSKEQVLRDRSWVLSQGWEGDPKSIPPIEQLLGIAADVPASV